MSTRPPSCPDVEHLEVVPHHREALHGGLQHADRVYLGDDLASTHTAQRVGAARAHLAEVAH
eukprot:4215177-Heterocapsa_arctica.AAC.1